MVSIGTLTARIIEDIAAGKHGDVSQFDLRASEGRAHLAGDRVVVPFLSPARHKARRKRRAV